MLLLGMPGEVLHQYVPYFPPATTTSTPVTVGRLKISYRHILSFAIDQERDAAAVAAASQI
jgi:hypothetical protein